MEGNAVNERLMKKNELVQVGSSIIQCVVVEVQQYNTCRNAPGQAFEHHHRAAIH
jgi:hypothetical protein